MPSVLKYIFNSSPLLGRSPPFMLLPLAALTVNLFTVVQFCGCSMINLCNSFPPNFTYFVYGVLEPGAIVIPVIVPVAFLVVVAAVPEPAPPKNLTLTPEVYPEPPFTNVAPLTTSFATIAVAVALIPPLIGSISIIGTCVVGNLNPPFVPVPSPLLYICIPSDAALIISPTAMIVCPP